MSVEFFMISNSARSARFKIEVPFSASFYIYATNKNYCAVDIFVYYIVAQQKTVFIYHLI